MAMRIVCSGYLVRYPLGGLSWHHLQYLIGFSRLGHRVVFLEHYGWPGSCYDPARNVSSPDPSYGLRYLQAILTTPGFEMDWCYLAEDGTAHGMSREALRDACAECDLYVNVSNINWIPELESCRRRVLVDTDPVFTQIGAHGLGGPPERYHALFTFGENVHRPGCDMPTRGVKWHATRQPVVLEEWGVQPGNRQAPFTTISSWSPIADRTHEGRVYGMKNREFEPYFTLPRTTGEPMEMALNAPRDVRERLEEGGWRLVNPREVTLDPWSYRRYLCTSRAEFAVAKHGYVTTRCGWFSERSAAYLASGRPVLVQETGFSQWLDTRLGVVPFRTPGEVRAGIDDINRRYDEHCRAARAVAVEYFDSARVLNALLDRALN
jgi:hypothetical protein